MVGVILEEHPIPPDGGLRVLPQHGTLGELLHRQRRTEERRRAVAPARVLLIDVKKRLGEGFPRLTPAAAFGVVLQQRHILLGLLVFLLKGGGRMRSGKRGREQGEGKGGQKEPEQARNGGGWAVRSLGAGTNHEGEAVLMGGCAASKKPARAEAGKAEGVREREPFPHPCF